MEPPLSTRVFGFAVGGGLLASGDDPSAPSRRALRASGCGSEAASGGLARSQWRVRAGFSPASLTTDLGRPRCIPSRRRHDRQSHAHLHPARRRRRDPPRRHEPRAQDRIRGSRPTGRSTSSTRSSASRSPPAACPTRYADWLRRVQNDLFDVGADISVPERRRRASACGSSPSRPPGSSRPATRSTPTLPTLKLLRAPRRHARPPRSCTSAARSAGAPSAARSPAATTSTPSACATSTGSRTCCSSSRAARTSPPAATEPLWEPGRYR